jgi:hypothetical protein
LRLDVAEELQATRANGLAVEQAGPEQVAVPLQSRAECSRVAYQRIGGQEPSEGIFRTVESAAARGWRDHDSRTVHAVA